MKHVFIINPRAGKGKALGVIRPQIESYIQEHGLDAEIHVPDSPHAAQEFIRAEASKGEPVRFYACGGDGTLFEAVNGAFGHPNAEVAVLPLGSGNDFIRLFGTPEQFLNVDAQVNGTPIELDISNAAIRSPSTSAPWALMRRFARSRRPSRSSRL